MIFDRIEYFSEYSVIKIISDMSERCLLSTRNSFITVLTKKTCKNSEISTSAGILAGRKLFFDRDPAGRLPLPVSSLLHIIDLSRNIANLVRLVLLGFPLTYPEKRIDECYAVGHRRRSASPRPSARFYE